MKNDIENRRDIDLLMNHFYARAIRRRNNWLYFYQCRLTRFRTSFARHRRFLETLLFGTQRKRKK
ncbi:MAG: hypothetical protein M3033_14790 [Acidobacteriota bacterium]|nr:hypothetical protein [Acidobacteriota bacterium]